MGHISRVLSSRCISYISIACGSLVIYKTFCARQRRRDFESSICVCSQAASVAARSVPLTPGTAKDESFHPFVNRAAAGSALSSSACGTCVRSDLPSVPHLRDEWRETLASAKAAATAAGLSEQEIHPRQLAAAIAAASILSKTHGNSCAFANTNEVHQPSIRLQAFSSMSSELTRLRQFLTCPATRQWRPLSGTSTTLVPNGGFADCPRCAKESEGSAAGPSRGADTLRSQEGSESLFSSRLVSTVMKQNEPPHASNVSKSPNVPPPQRLCVGRIAAVQVVRRKLRIGGAGDGAPHISGERERRQRSLSRSFIQWPGKYLRITYQYFVVSPDKWITDMTGRTLRWCPGSLDEETHKTAGAVAREKTVDGQRGDNCLPVTPRSGQETNGPQVGLSFVKYAAANDTHKPVNSLPEWKQSWAQRLRAALGTVTHILPIYRSVDVSTTHDSDPSTRESMPPLSIFEMTVEFRLPPDKYMEKHRRKAVNRSLPPASEDRDSPRSELSPVAKTSAPAVDAEASQQAKVPEAGAANSAPERECLEEITGTRVAPAQPSADRGIAFSENNYTQKLTPSREIAHSCGCQPEKSDKEDLDICVKPVKRLMHTWQDITPQQLVIVSYEIEKPFESTPLVVLTRPGKTPFSSKATTVENGAMERKSAQENEKCLGVHSREGKVRWSERRDAALLTSECERDALRKIVGEKGNTNLCGKQRNSTYSGELIELSGNPVEGDEKGFLTAGGLLVSLGVLKLSLQKLLLRRVPI